jgi:hypothetical protein
MPLSIRLTVWDHKDAQVSSLVFEAVVIGVPLFVLLLYIAIKMKLY